MRISDWSSDVCSSDLLDNLKRKIDAGASRAITQFFFDPDDYLRFVDRARAAGIKAPIVPGILPIVNFERTRQMAQSCKAALPLWLVELYADLEEADEEIGRASCRERVCQYVYVSVGAVSLKKKKKKK